MLLRIEAEPRAGVDAIQGKLVETGLFVEVGDDLEVVEEFSYQLPIVRDHRELLPVGANGPLGILELVPS